MVKVGGRVPPNHVEHASTVAALHAFENRFTTKKNTVQVEIVHAGGYSPAAIFDQHRVAFCTFHLYLAEIDGILSGFHWNVMC